MLKIGMDKTDRTFRKFEYDDERKYGNPLVYKVLYEETGVFGEVLCSNVISIKKSNNTKNHFLDIPIYGSVTKNEQTVNESVDKTSKPTEVIEEKKKPKATKTKSKTTTLKGEPVEVKEISLGLNVSSTSFEYDVFVVDNISYTDDIKHKLNEFGKDGWEVCGFQIMQKLFGSGSQAIIIMKKGLN